MRTMVLGAMLTAMLTNAMNAGAVSPVKVCAEVTRPENNRNPVTITVRNADGDTLWTRTSRADRFAVRLPEDEQYTISFEQPHCIRKDVSIDAAHAAKPGAKNKLHKVAFEVVLDIDPGADLRYAGPVGRIELLNGNGRLNVERDYAMVKVAR